MNLKQIRRERGITQQEAADILGVSRRGYQMLEKDGAEKNEKKYEYYCGVLSGSETSRTQKQAPYKTNVLRGNDLWSRFNEVSMYRKRAIFKYLRTFIEEKIPGKVCILFGLRRTGKTTMLFQLLGEIDKQKAVYIKIQESNTMADLIDDMYRLSDEGVKYVLIDEVTLLEDFINSASALSDIFAMMGMKIVLSGTDSLGFSLAKRDELYDRAITIHTSYIPFKDWSETLGIYDIDKYIEYGGTLKKENMGFDDPEFGIEEVAFRDDESTRKYIDTAISKNIQRSLKNDSFGASFYALRELYDNNELTNVINRLVQNMNHDFLVSVVEERFKSPDLGSARQMLFKRPKRETSTVLRNINGEEVISRLKRIIEIKEKEEVKISVSQEAIQQIKKYLYELDLLKDVEYRYDDGTKEKKAMFTQPGMRYSIAKALCFSLMNDSYFNTIGEAEKNEILETILNDVKGRMLEEIVLLETTRRNPEKELVFKYQRKIDPGEIDMVVYNEENNTFDLYEIKHTTKCLFDEQTKYLRDKGLIKEIERKYGMLNKKYVLYRGFPMSEEQGIKYSKVESFLIER